METKLGRGKYFGWALAILFSELFIGLAIDPNYNVSWAYMPPPHLAGAIYLLWIAQSIALIVLCTGRCNDIGINRWWSLLVLVPLVSLYFLFRRGSLYYDSAISNEAAERAARIERGNYDPVSRPKD